MRTKETTIFIPMKGVGSSPVCYSSVLSHFKMDECRGNKIIQTPKKEATKFSLYFLHSFRHFTSFFWLSLFTTLSLSPNGPNLSIRLLEGIKTRSNKGYEFFACDFIIFGKSGLIGFLLREGGVLRIRIVISHPPCTPEFSWLPRSYENRDLSLLFGLFKHQSSPSSKLWSWCRLSFIWQIIK